MVKWAVYCIVYFVFLVCQGQDLADTDGFSNDSPFNVEPIKVETVRAKEGTHITIKCASQFPNHTFWENKECELSYTGVMCNLKDLTNTNERQEWTKRSNRHRFEISSLARSDSGAYRCIEKDIVKKAVIIEVVGIESYDGPPPAVQALLTSNITGQLNMEFTIQCNITSKIPPTVIWFKKCYGSKCDIEYDDICYCHLNISTSFHNIGDTYISKMNIFNAKVIDSGLYACLAVTEYGKDYKYVTIKVPDDDMKPNGINSFPLLFLVPLALVAAPVLVWVCYFKRKTKKRVTSVKVGQQQEVLLRAPRAIV
ncbi:unnamed protein product [Ceutorhynchus assimilis]|uniref:Ig-like domain-containing protein n=1 Tax=Ceutorhynchus assimilis TaxID=467358 RepID=A0A9N9QIV7_9CUCU|nr:unnamed protein product [Ceutorhynchus assimilis]